MPLADAESMTDKKGEGRKPFRAMTTMLVSLAVGALIILAVWMTIR